MLPEDTNMHSKSFQPASRSRRLDANQSCMHALAMAMFAMFAMASAMSGSIEHKRCTYISLCAYARHKLECHSEELVISVGIEEHGGCNLTSGRAEDFCSTRGSHVS